ncbi:hypothetical protein D3C87_2081480 [compost metagenome]
MTLVRVFALLCLFHQVLVVRGTHVLVPVHDLLGSVDQAQHSLALLLQGTAADWLVI